MARLLTSAALAIVLAGCTAGQTAQTITSAPQPEAPVSPASPLAALVDQVDIPYERFTLENGLTTLVHTDRKAPIVGVTIYYRVGSKHEPRGRTGFAHLFEHLMFGGSENVENFDIPLEAAGSTSTNGSTWYDRTNYVETLPTGALDLALFMESDRMGHLLGAVSQDKLDKQRGVVQNEKRQGDNQPYGLAQYAMTEGLLPVGHPYRHSTIGSMADLDAASLADVRTWFSDNYGPNNVVVALAGDIDAATARAKVEQWFGDIPPGPEIARIDAGPVTLPANVSRDMFDSVPMIQVNRAWTGPGLTHPDAVPLSIGMYILGGLASSRLDNILVRDEQLAVRVSAYSQQHEQLGFLLADMDIKEGVERAAAEARMDSIISDFIANGPTQDELQRAVTQLLSQQIDALEEVGGFSGKGATLAEGLLYAGDPQHYKAELQRMAALTPGEVQAAMARWLTRPVYKLAILPGERTDDGALMGGWGDETAVPPPAPDTGTSAATLEQGPARAAPMVAPVGQLAFPAVTRATLGNGIQVVLANRTSVPKVMVRLEFDAGDAVDGVARAGTHSLMMNLLTQGTTTRDATEIAMEQERLGASINAGSSTDSSAITLSALKTNLEPSLALMADIARNPAFAPTEVERLKGQTMAAIAQEMADPMALAYRAMGPLLFGDHPYAVAGNSGNRAVIETLGPEAMAAEHAKWLRPDLARITVVGDITLDQIMPRLEQAFGKWPTPDNAAPRKDLDAATPGANPRIVVVNRPNSPQSVLLLGRILPLRGTDKGLEPLDLANEVLGSGFLSRLNSNLREEKGWTYGVRSQLGTLQGPTALQVITPVQADRTADSITLILKEMAAFPASRPVDGVELQRVTDGNIRGLPNRFQTNGQVMGALVTNQRLGRPDDYQSKLPEIYRGVDAAAINDAARTYLHGDGLIIVVVGDRSVIDGQLARLGLPIEYAAE